MASTYLSKLTREQRDKLLKDLLEIQSGNCFICGDPIDLGNHEGQIDIDHVEPISTGGKDVVENFAATHQSCNRSKQSSNLEIARRLKKFEKHTLELQEDNRHPNLGTVLSLYDGGKYKLNFKLVNGSLQYSFPHVGQNQVVTSPIYEDELSGFRYTFMNIPKEYLHHDDKINPRSIGRNLKKLVEEFHKKLPQLHVALAWIESNKSSKVKVFDGQHKAAAQILLGAKWLPVRIFVDPDKDRLLTANTHAGTTLRQVAFDKSVQHGLGSSLLLDRMRRYQTDLELDEDQDYSEQDLVNHFAGEKAEIRRYVRDWCKNSVTNHNENKLRDYIEYGGRKTDMPLSFSTVEKTFYSYFIYKEMLNTPFNYKMEEGENPRTLETENLVRLMSIIASAIYIDKFDLSRGTKRIEYDVQHGNEVANDHLRAFRMAKEELLHNWLRYVKQVVQSYFITLGKPFNEQKLFQYLIPADCWTNVEKFVKSLSRMSFWVNHDLSLSVFGTKQRYNYWETIFETGSSPDGTRVLPRGLDFMDMIKGEEDAF